jgi:hypothetical protein
MTVRHDLGRREELIDATEDVDAILDADASGLLGLSPLFQARLLDRVDAIYSEVARCEPVMYSSKAGGSHAPAIFREVKA